MSGGSTRSFPFQSGSCGIPSTAQAYSFHLTVIPSGALGYVTVWPAGQSQPVVSNINSDGRVKTAGVIVAAGTGGAVDMFASNQTDIVADVDGYFEPDTAQLSYFPITPCRVADTRSSTPPSLTGGVVHNFTIASSSCGIPVAAAYALTFTSIPNGAPASVAAWPAGQPQPSLLTVLYTGPNDVVAADFAIVAAGSGGQISVEVANGSNTDLVIDVSGYFSAGSGGLSLYNISPCRPVVSGTFSGTGSFTVGGTCGIPTSAQAYVLNATVVPSGPLGYVTLWSGAGSMPVTSNLDDSDGVVTSDLAIVQQNSNLISAFASNSTQLVLDAFGYFAP